MKRTMISAVVVLVLLLTMMATVAMAATFQVDARVTSLADVCRLVEVYGGQEILWNFNFDGPTEGHIYVFAEKAQALVYEQSYNGGSVQGGFTAKLHDDSYRIRVTNEGSVGETHVTGVVELPGY